MTAEPALALIRVELPSPLCLLANLPRELRLQIPPPYTLATVLDALEHAHPALLGTIRDRQTHRRRPYIRIFANNADLSHELPDAPLPIEILTARAPLLIVGAIAGG